MMSGFYPLSFILLSSGGLEQGGNNIFINQRLGSDSFLGAMDGSPARRLRPAAQPLG
jgi:hypothetical protein